MRKDQLEQKYSRSVQRIKRQDIDSDSSMLTPTRKARFLNFNEDKYSKTIVKANNYKLLEPENEDEDGIAYHKIMVGDISPTKSVKNLGDISPTKSIKSHDLSIVEEKPVARFVVVKKLTKDKQSKAQS